MHGILFSIYTAFILCAGSVFGACVLKRRAEETFPLSLFAITLWLYAFYLFDWLRVGYWSAVALCGACYAASAVSLLKSRDVRGALARLFTPAMAAFALVMLVVVLWTPKYVQLWDELRYWAAVPKALYYNERLLLGENAILWSGMFNTYFPGMQLFQYFFAKTRRVFSENHLFVSYCLLSLSVFLPALKRLRWRDALLVPFAALLILSAPQTFANQAADEFRFYTTLYIEAPLGLFFGAGLFRAAQNPARERFDAAGFALSLAMLTLLKDTGVAMAAFCLLAAAFVARRSEVGGALDGRERAQRRMRLLLAAATVLAAWAGWKTVCRIHQASAWFAGGAAANASPGAALAAFLPTFLRRLLEQPVTYARLLDLVSANGSVTLVGAAAILVGMGLVTLRLQGREARRALCVVGAAWACFFLAYLAGLCWLFCSTFGGETPSYARYVTPPLLGGMTLLILLWLSALPLREEDAHARYPALLLLTAVLFAFFPCGEHPFQYGGEATHAEALSMQSSIEAQLPAEAHESNAGVLLLVGEAYAGRDIVLLHHHLLLDLYGDHLFLKTYFPSYRAAPATTDASPAAFAEAAENCQYVYAAPESGGLQAVADAYFGGTILPDTVYRIERGGAGMRCTPVF